MKISGLVHWVHGHVHKFFWGSIMPSFEAMAFRKEDHGLYSSVDPSYAVSGALSLGERSFAWTLGTLIWFLWTPKVNKIPLKKLGKIQIFVFLGTKMPIARALLGPNGRNFDTRTVGV